jgi:branched-chain amino acid transport system ATP-binding protein
MADALLEVSGLSVRYGAVSAVESVDLAVDRGETVGLVGANGAGKSSTLLAVTGVVQAEAGDIRLDGRSVAGLPTERIARAGMALVPEGRHVFSSFTVEENLRLGLLGRSEPEGADEDLAWVRELFPVVATRANEFAGHLSGGQQQMLVIARALLTRPRVLLLDEPSLGLAPTVVETVFEALTEVRRRGVAILLVEQRAQVTVGFADRTHVMRGGRIVMTLKGDDEMDMETMAEAYFG